MVRDDHIRGYGQLLDWALERGVLRETEVDQLREEAAADLTLGAGRSVGPGSFGGHCTTA